MKTIRKEKERTVVGERLGKERKGEGLHGTGAKG
jgi:hypothetical protein